jgi:hypothetical protein
MKKYVFPMLLACILVNGCVKLYTLPDPPPKEEWVDIALENEDPEIKAKRILDAKKAAIQCLGALVSKNWSKALSYMSDNTQAALMAASGSQGPESVFQEGIALVNGEKRAFDPVGDVFITNVVDIRDEFADRKDVENTTRHVFYAVDASENAREIIMILEDGKWVLDKPQLFSALLAP